MKKYRKSLCEFYSYLSAYLEVVEVILLHIFFIMIAACFYGNYFLSHFLETVLLGMMPLCAVLGIKSDRKVKGQSLFLNCFSLLIWVGGVLNAYTDKSRLGLIVWGFMCIISAVLIWSIFWRRQQKESRINLYIVGLIILFFVFAYETINEMPVCDAGVYYAVGVSDKIRHFDFTLDNIFDYCLAGHLSVGYGLLTLLGEMICMGSIGVHIVNILLAMLSIYCFHGILKELLQDKNETEIVLGTACYAFCPYLLGMIGLINVDNPCLPLFTIFVYTYVKKIWMLYTFSAWMFVFTKEPCLIYFLFFEFGIWIYNIILFKKKKRVQDRTYMLINILTLLLAVYFLLYFFAPGRGNWVADLSSMLNGENSSKWSIHFFGFSMSNFIIKMKQIFLCNFNWLLVISCILTLLTCKAARKQFKKNFFLYCPIVFAMVGILIFNFFYIDIPIPRYIVVSEALLLLITIPIFISINNKRGRILLAGLGTLFLVQCFITIDPCSIKAFRTIKRDDAKTNLLNVGSEVQDYGDGSIYNREYSYFIGLLEKTLEEADYNEDMVIVFPEYNVSPIHYAVHYGGMNQFLWDRRKNQFEAKQQYSAVPVNIAQSDTELSEYAKVLYVVPFYAEEDEEIKNRMKISKKGKVSYRMMDLVYYVGIPFDDK